MNNLFETFASVLNPEPQKTIVITTGSNSVEFFTCVDGTVVKTFNKMAEDYAYTDNRDFAYKLKKDYESKGYSVIN